MQGGSFAKFLVIVALPRVASQITHVPEANIRIVDLISFKGAQFPKSMILYAVYFYVRFPISYRDLEVRSWLNVALIWIMRLSIVGSRNMQAPLPKRRIVERHQRVVRGGWTKLM